MGVSRRQLRAMARKADMILLKAGALADEINRVRGTESEMSDLGDDVLCTAETLADAFARMVKGISKP